MTATTAQYTEFSKDVLGRYVCNGFDEAIASTAGPGARSFDIVIVGGGSFGSVLAQHLLYSDRFRNHRVLILEAGPLVFPEHVQNLPTLGLAAPGPTTIDPGKPRAEVWGLPWRSAVEGGYPGLAYCVGGRSIFWGGWSPQLLDTAKGTEMPRSRWPEAVVQDLNDRLFAEAAEQIGTTETNDFVFGTMHAALRDKLYQGIKQGAVADAIPLADLPLHLATPSNASPTEKAQRKLEAPLAVQGRAERSGFFPLNKFSGTPLMIRAARQAWFESGGDDRQKRLMVVPNCHVTRLDTEIRNGIGVVRAVETNFGVVPVPERGVVVLAAGTIESTRLALLSFGGVTGYGLIGTNLVGHMRSNYTVTIPRAQLGFLPTGDLEASALFVKGRKDLDGQARGYFHIQITAAGGKGVNANSEAELFQKIPDIDTVDNFRAADEDSVVITFRGVGEIQAGNPDNRITLSAETDEFGIPRAFVQLGNPKSGQPQPGESTQTGRDRIVWAAMDDACRQTRAIFGAAAPGEQVVRDGLGTTHHEAGTLWMGTDPTASVTTPNARFHHVLNAYAVGPALLPTMGSPNPMLSGVALARRLAEHLVAPSPAPAVATGFAPLFDGTQAMFNRWRYVGPGSFQYDANEGLMVAQPDGDIGLLFWPEAAFGDFVFQLQFRLDNEGDNSGVFVRFADPLNPPATLSDPRAAGNPAWVAVDTGFEVQIDELARPDGADMHRTGAIYAIDTAGGQLYQQGSSLQPGEWNDYEVATVGDTYKVRLNGFETASFVNADPSRGQPGFVGLQSHTGRVAFRAVRIKA